MIKNFKVSDKIGDVVVAFPGASNIFLNKKIDFCCGGNRELSVAIKEQKLDENKIIEELNEKYKEFQENNEVFTDWVLEAPSKLIDYIVGKHHVYLNQELPKIGELTLKILKVHGENHEELFKVHKLFNSLKTELEEHLIKEEELVFPLIKKYEVSKNKDDRKKAIKKINELEDEHVGAGDIIKELREVTDHYTVPQDACRTYVLAYEKLKEIEVDIFHHIHLENNILFKNI